MIWFTADTHYNHKNICRGVSNWENKETASRDFKTLEKMNFAIVANINSCVSQYDTLYHLGDWSFGGIENVWKFYERITCKNIHIIPGNHDEHIKKNKLLPNCHDTNSGFKSGCNPEIYKDSRDNYFDVYAQSLFSSVNNYLEIELNGQLFVMSHYPIDDWFDMGRKASIMLHGHNHHTLDKSFINSNYKRMDVGMDWEEFRPYSIDEVIRLMDTRKIKEHSS